MPLSTSYISPLPIISGPGWIRTSDQEKFGVIPILPISQDIQMVWGKQWCGQKRPHPATCNYLANFHQFENSIPKAIIRINTAESNWRLFANLAKVLKGRIDPYPNKVIDVTLK
jgi:hypothetical protein